MKALYFEGFDQYHECGMDCEYCGNADGMFVMELNGDLYCSKCGMRFGNMVDIAKAADGDDA